MNINLDKLTDDEAKEMIYYLTNFIKDKNNKYYMIDGMEVIIKKYIHN